MKAVKRFWPSTGALAEALVIYATFIIGYRYGLRALDTWWGSRPLGWLVPDLGLLLGLGSILLLVARFGVLSSQVDIDRRSVRHKLAWAAATIAALGLLAVFVRIFDPGSDDWEFARRGLGNLSAFRRFLFTIPFAVIGEEIVFRGCQRRLRFVAGSLPAVVIVTISFAWIHVRIGPGMTIHETATAAALLAGGPLLATLYELSKSVPLLIGVHLVYDLLAVTQAWLHVQRHFAAEVALFVFWIALSILTFAVLRFEWRQKPVSAENSIS